MNCYFCNGPTEKTQHRYYDYYQCKAHKERVLHWDDTLYQYDDFPANPDDLKPFTVVDIEVDSKWIRALWLFADNKFNMFYLDWNEEGTLFELDKLPDYSPEDILGVYQRIMKLKAFL